MPQIKLRIAQHHKIVSSFLIFLFTASSVFCIHNSNYDSKWTFLLLGLVGYFSWFVGRKTHFILGLGIFYALIQPVLNAYSDIALTVGKPYFMTLWARESAAFTLMLFSFMLCSIREKSLYKIIRYMAWYGLADSIFSLFYRGGFLLEPSMNACFIAVTFPILWFTASKYWKTFCILPIVAIILSQSTTATGILGVSLFGVAWFSARKIAMFFMLVFIVVIGFGYYIQGEWFYRSGDRFEMQKRIVRVYLRSDFKAKVFGYGIGSFYALGPRMIGKSKKEYWLHCHSDLLLLLFNLGIIGVAIFTIAVLIALRKAYADPLLFSALLSGVAFFAIQYPLFKCHDAFLCGLLFIASYRVTEQDVNTAVDAA